MSCRVSSALPPIALPLHNGKQWSANTSPAKLWPVSTVPVKPLSLWLQFCGKVPGLREQGRLRSLVLFEQQGLSEPLFDALNDPSLTVKKAAFQALRRLLPPHYSQSDAKKYQQILTQAKEAIAKGIPDTLKTLEQQGCQVLYGNDTVPAKLVSEDFLAERGHDDEDIEDIITHQIPITIRQAFQSDLAGEFIAATRKHPNYMLLSMSAEKTDPQTFWHEYIHFLQYQAGLTSRVKSRKSQKQIHFLREMEANQFVLDHAEQLKTPAQHQMQELRLWHVNMVNYLYHRDGKNIHQQHRFGMSA